MYQTILVLILLSTLFGNPDYSKVQIIDDAGKFISELNFPGSKKVAVVATIGQQSIGKSTQNNLLFKTNFTVMDESEWQRTTEGIWMSLGKIPDKFRESFNKTLLVLDVEGSDSYDKRNEVETTDNQKALFALAEANVLMVILRESDLGKYKTACVPILEKVLKNILKLSPGMRDMRKTLLFVIQEREILQKPITERTEKIRKQIKMMLKNIWTEMKNTTTIDMDTLFTTVVYPLPQFFIPGSKMVKESVLDELRQMFFNSKHEKYLKSLDANNFANIDTALEVGKVLWERIQNNEDLNVTAVQGIVEERRRLEEERRRVIEELKRQQIELEKKLKESEPRQKAEAKKLEEEGAKRDRIEHEGRVDEERAEAKRKFEHEIYSYEDKVLLGHREERERITKVVRVPIVKFFHVIHHYEVERYSHTRITTIYDFMVRTVRVFEDGHEEKSAYVTVSERHTVDSYVSGDDY